MEQNLPVIAKRIWGIVRVVYFMLRKGITSKRKLLLDLNMFMKRGKIAGKAALTNLMTFHVSSSSSSSSFRRSSSAAELPVPVGEYEFSCSNTPSYGPFHLSSSKHHHRRHAHHFFACAHAPPTQDDDVVSANAIKAVLEMLNNNDQALAAAVEASPALPGFGRSPAVVRQLRITDSPFPLRESDDVDSRQVDEAAEEFIKRFYKDLRMQKSRSMAD